MTMRPEVKELMALGPFPTSQSVDLSVIALQEKLLHSIERPLSRDEADLMVGLFGPDDYFGLAWTLLHLLETAPGGAVCSAPEPGANDWVRELWERIERARGL